jgi:protein O-mannosyl-transferase
VFLSTVGQAYYRPMMTISLILDAQIGGASPFIYHFTDIVIHLLASCLLFLFFKKLNYRKDLSFFFALIFAIHPVLSQAVGWIPGRNDTLLTVFILLAFIAFIDSLIIVDNLFTSNMFTIYFEGSLSVLVFKTDTSNPI